MQAHLPAIAEPTRAPLRFNVFQHRLQRGATDLRVACVAKLRTNLPASNLLPHTHQPLRSKYSTLICVARRLANTNRCPASGSVGKLWRASAYKPSQDLALRRVGSAGTRGFGFRGKKSAAHQVQAEAAAQIDAQIQPGVLGRSRSGSAQQTQVFERRLRRDGSRLGQRRCGYPLRAAAQPRAPAGELLRVGPSRRQSASTVIAAPSNRSSTVRQHGSSRRRYACRGLAVFHGPRSSCCVDEEHSSEIGGSTEKRRRVTACASTVHDREDPETFELAGTAACNLLADPAGCRRFAFAWSILRALTHSQRLSRLRC